MEIFITLLYGVSTMMFLFIFYLFLIMMIKGNLKNNIGKIDNKDKNADSNNLRIIPDDVREEKPTNKSTQKEDCKVYAENNKYTFTKTSKVEKTIIENNSYDNDYQKNETTDSPIKENENILSKLFKGPDKL